MKRIQDIDTPALLVDYEKLQNNIKTMQERAKKANVNLRPHTKTHRTPALALMQVQAGSKGITVAKVGEAEVMAENGLDDIFIANQIFGTQKMQRLNGLAEKVKVSMGVDNEEQVMALSQIFKDGKESIQVLIEVETGEERSGIVPGDKLVQLARFIQSTPNVWLKGVFSHEGHTYGAATRQECAEQFRKSQQDTLDAAKLIRDVGIELEVISIGATPSILIGEILPGITEIRPGTYILMDAAQGHAIEDYGQCAATVLATVVSKPTSDRVVLDAGVKALTAFTRSKGICYTPGYGLVKGNGNLRISKLYDEHGLIIDRETASKLAIGDKIQIIPNHICPTCNLYDNMYLVKDENIIQELPILCRGKSQ